MSELINTKQSRNEIHRYLLVSTSAAVLAASANAFAADDTDRPTIWIELGGQWEQMTNAEEPYVPSFVSHLPGDGFFSPLDVQKPLVSSIGGEGAVSFEPEGSDWIFSASVHFGRSNGIKQQHQQTPNAKVLESFTLPPPFSSHHVGPKYYYPSNRVRFSDAKAQQSESHTVLDFQAGKDVGLGMFGRTGSSVFSAGVRYAQFGLMATVNLHAVPDLHYPTAPITNLQERAAFLSGQNINFHAYSAFASVHRSFRGLGPSLTWKASAPFVGGTQRGGIAVDWGINGSILFGRQKARGRHQETTRTYHLSQWTHAGEGGHFLGPNRHNSHYVLTSAIAVHTNAANFNRNRTVIVPNLGGFAGVSFLYANAKVSFGYRADLFFGAMDGGIDARQNENVGFYGPFATISVGFGG